MLRVAVFVEDERDGALHEWELGGVGSHGCDPGGQDRAYVESVCPGSGNVAEAAFDEEVCGEVIEALRCV